MASTYQNLSDYDPEKIPDASGMSFAIAVAEWNHEITNSLLKACCDTLIKHGVKKDRIYIMHVPGAYELPKACDWLTDFSWPIDKNQTTYPDAIIALGCVITGETKHDEYISNAVSDGMMKLNLDYELPYVFGLLTPRTMEQAKDRAGGKHGNKGVEAAVTAIKMAHTFTTVVKENDDDPFYFEDLFPN